MPKRLPLKHVSRTALIRAAREIRLYVEREKALPKGKGYSGWECQDPPSLRAERKQGLKVILEALRRR